MISKIPAFYIVQYMHMCIHVYTCVHACTPAESRMSNLESRISRVIMRTRRRTGEARRVRASFRRTSTPRLGRRADGLEARHSWPHENQATLTFRSVALDGDFHATCHSCCFCCNCCGCFDWFSPSLTPQPRIRAVAASARCAGWVAQACGGAAGLIAAIRREDGGGLEKNKIGSM